MILLIDNYDSFAFNLARYLEELGETVQVRRNDDVDPATLGDEGFSHIVISPGPCTPAEAGASVDVVRAVGAEIPILGVCLGHQCIAAATGGRVVRAARPMHGRLSAIRHEGRGLFAGLPSPLEVTRYHSLVVDSGASGTGLRVTARTEEGEVMALEHVSWPVWGVQFHPEAVLTAGGHRLLGNFLSLGRGDIPASEPVEAGLCPELPAAALR
ncbi:anthranilate synthase component II [Candidatus Palauibacter sp.]|uniref:anthranilate synthase component II n=1 Tax=Candidatus Palauibacter sp. TaxID=3101350 RepID=UPI003B51F476